jgi:hypothetical protein
MARRRQPDQACYDRRFCLQRDRELVTLPAMERVALKSHVIVSAGYDAATRVLELEFASGRIYQYADVPSGTFEWLLRAPSKGGFVTRMINGQYLHRDVTPASETADLSEALRASLEARTGGEPQ